MTNNHIEYVQRRQMEFDALIDAQAPQLVPSTKLYELCRMLYFSGLAKGLELARKEFNSNKEVDNGNEQSH